MGAGQHDTHIVGIRVSFPHHLFLNSYGSAMRLAPFSEFVDLVYKL